jgi:hypothetical protein
MTCAWGFLTSRRKQSTGRVVVNHDAIEVGG